MQHDDPLPLEIDCLSARQTLAASSCLLLDCREQLEFDLARIEGATLLPMSEIERRLEELEPHRDRRLIVYCHHGVRSVHVAHWLRRQGFPKVQSMAGGIDAWSQTIDPAIPRY
jgi:rhodanese-related sulfurtransferase